MARPANTGFQILIRGANELLAVTRPGVAAGGRLLPACAIPQVSTSILQTTAFQNNPSVDSAGLLD
ncbi:hypothetical protein I7I53_01035 [Histoplasma capsulatum var. duboisii H88]|uniref:Uncharacterized protein n=1 Tax=Ajellomyces capsulatus (strain H88) TaxID=544711 RepID=A0A8A1LP49_AJEC8|nr:hypothetical protein I7I53_01035 [Histoplasma capsulatum var. duboisii H88]